MNHAIELKPLHPAQELKYKKMLIDNQRWKFNKAQDPVWKADLFVDDFSLYCENFNNSNSLLVWVGPSLKGEVVFNNHKKEIFLTAQALKENPELLHDTHLILTKLKLTGLKSVPRMVLRFFKILPGWL